LKPGIDWESLCKMNGELTVRRVESLSSPGRHRVAPNLFLFIDPPARKSWLCIFVCPLSGRSHEMGLGPFSLVSVQAAKAAALQHRMAVFAKRCPLCARTEDAPRSRMAFAEVTKLYIAAHCASWRHPRHRKAWERLHVDAALLWKRPVDTIDTAAVMGVLEAGWTSKAITLSRVRGRIEAVLDFAAVRGWRPDAANPARWKGHLDQLLPPPKKVQPVTHLASLPWQDAPAFWATLEGRNDLPTLAIRLLALTAARRSEALEATWPEIDREAAVWTIPAARTKANREHHVPLSPAALAVIDALAAIRRSDRLFPGMRQASSLSATAVLVAMQAVRPDVTLHGLRSTFRSWCAEQADVRQDLAEAALGHAISNQVVAAYQRNDLFNLRTDLMARWAGYLTGAGS
jgi:integrase